MRAVVPAPRPDRYTKGNDSPPPPPKGLLRRTCGAFFFCACEAHALISLIQTLDEMKLEMKPIKIDRRLTGSSFIDEPLQQVCPSTSRRRPLRLFALIAGASG